MNREIKFRAWHSVVSVMLEVGDEYGTSHPLDCCDYKLEGQPVELMQYTGLKDKNGVEIYEGDIVRTTVGEHWWLYAIEPSKISPNGQLYAIEKLSNCSIVDEVYTYTVTSENSGCRNELLYGNDYEVIGNIYENPELLKE